MIERTAFFDPSCTGQLDCFGQKLRIHPNSVPKGGQSVNKQLSKLAKIASFDNLSIIKT
jgi:hypothetical protein